MPHHEGISGLQIRKLILVLARHLIEHRTFQVHDLIMRQHKYIFFRICIGHGKRHFIVIITAEIRVQLHVFEEIVHPAHVPLH